jgi:2-oxoacid:acceptor oxidoreductase delta subunit (pyruvate/2-ketoisovalerate family)
VVQDGVVQVDAHMMTGHAGLFAGCDSVRRCMSCGNCFECDNCYGVCPDNAVIKHGPGRGLDLNYDYCKGCGVCAAECPCGAIRMEPEAL